MRIAILGAPQTGKSQLTLALHQHLVAHHLDLVVLDAPAVQEVVAQDIVLLCGLDVRSVPSNVHDKADAALREALTQQNTSFQVVYGQGGERLKHALYAAAQQAQALGLDGLANHMRKPLAVRWTGACDNCADAACEHQLFSRLLAQKGL